MDHGTKGGQIRTQNPDTGDRGIQPSAPVPLRPIRCDDQLKYVAPKTEKEHSLYITLLGEWEASDAAHPFLRAILSYVEGGTIITDLLQAGVLVLDSKGKYDEKQLVCWRVNGVEGEEPACWKNQKLFAAYIQYYKERIANRMPGTVYG